MTKNQPVFEKTKPKWTLIKEYDNPNIDILFNAYQNDHKKAKVIYCQRNNEKGLRISQYRGFSNEDAPSLLRSLVSDKVTEFNKQGISEYLVDGFPVTEDLPF